MFWSANIRRSLRQYSWITLGCFLFALAVSFCLEPWELAAGGVSGLAIVLVRFLPLETGTVILLLNLPLLWFGWRRFGGGFLAETAYATILSALMTNGFDYLQKFLAMPPLTEHIWWAALWGGVFSAVGIGIIFREGGTTGGTDILVHLLHHRYRSLSPGLLFLVVDVSVIALAVFSGIGTQNVCWAVVSLGVFSLVLNRVVQN